MLELLEPRYLLAGQSTPATASLTRFYEGVSQLETFGRRIEESVAAVAPAASLANSPILEDGLDGLLGIGDALRSFSGQLLQPAEIIFADGVNSAPDPTYNLTSPLEYQVTMDGAAPREFRATVPATLPTGISERREAWRSALQASLVTGGVADQLEWVVSTSVPAGESSSALVLRAKNNSIGRLHFTSARVVAASANAPSLGQPISDVTFQVTNLTLRTLDGASSSPQSSPPISIGNLTVSLPRAAQGENAVKTNDNATLADLADDLNRAFTATNVRFPSQNFDGANSEDASQTNRSLGTYLHATVSSLSGNNRLAIVSRHGSVQSFGLSGAGLSLIGFTGATGLTASDIGDAFTKLGLRGQSASRQGNVTLIDQVAANPAVLGSTIRNLLTTRLGVSGTIKFDPSEANPISVQFPVSFNSTKSSPVNLDLNRSINIPGIGTLEFTSQATATGDVKLNNSILVGISLEGNDRSPTTLLSPLADLADRRGIRPIVGVAGTQPISSAVLANDISFVVKTRAATGALVPTTIHVKRSDTITNTRIEDLISDINLAIANQDLQQRIEAKWVDGRFHLRAVDRTISYLEVVAGAMAPGLVSSVTALGLGSGRAATLRSTDIPSGSNSVVYPDLVIEFDPSGASTRRSVNLDGAVTMQDAINLINAHTGFSNFASLVNGNVMLRSIMPFRAVAGAVGGIRSEAASALGILGSSRVVGGTNELTGGGSDRLDLGDRVYLVTRDPMTNLPTSTLGVDLKFTASDVNMGVGLGALGLYATSDELRFGFQLNAALTDPGIGANNDDRLTLRELMRSSPSDLFSTISVGGLPPAANFNTGGTLAVKGSLFDGAATGAGTFTTDQTLAKLKLVQPGDITTLSLELDTSQTNFSGLLSQLRRLTPEQIVDVVRGVVTQWTDANSPLGKLLRLELPVVGSSFGDALDFVDKLDAAVQKLTTHVDDRLLQTGLNELESAVANLPIADAVTERIRAAIQDARVDVETVRAAGAPQLAAVTTRLIAAISTIEREATRLPGSVGGVVTGQLRTQLDAVKSLLPSVDQIASRLADAIRRQLPGLDSVDFKFDIVNAGTTASPLWTVLVGLNIDEQIQRPIEPPEISTSLGPINVSVRGSATPLVVSARVGVGGAIMLSATPELRVLINPPATLNGQPIQAVKTEFVLGARAVGDVTAGVRIGGLSIVDGSIHINVSDSAAGNATPGNGNASVGFAFNTTTGPLGAVPLNALSSVPLTATSIGSVNARVDASLLGRTVPNAATVSASMANLVAGTLPTITINESQLAGLLTDFDFDLTTILAGINTFLETLQETLRNELDELPLIGSQLADLGGLIEGLRVNFYEKLQQIFAAFPIRNLEDARDATQLGLYQAFEASGVSGLTLLNYPGTTAGVDFRDIIVVLDNDKFEIRAVVAFNRTISIDVYFDAKLPGLPLAAAGQGGVNVTVGAAAYVGLGVGRTSGFYLLPSPLTTNVGMLPAGRELAFSLTVGLRPTALEVDLFALKVNATNRDTRLQVAVTADFYNRDAIASNAPFTLNKLGATFSGGGTAKLDFMLAAAAGPLPKIQADLIAQFGINFGPSGIVLTNNPGDSFALNNIQLDVGDFLRQFIGPAAEKIRQALNPIDPLLGLLQREVPGISEISKLAGQGPVTLLDLALAEVKREVASETRRFVNFLSALKNLNSRLSSISSSGFINFGSVSFATANLMTRDWNLTATPDITSNPPALPAGLRGLVNSLRRDTDELPAQLPNGGAPPTGTPADDGLGIKFHILDNPATLVRVLLGQTVELITWDIPELNLDFSWSQSFPVLPTPPISVEIGLNAAFSLALGVGFDSRGLQTDNLLDGFFINDLRDGVDIEELKVSLGVTAAALLDLGIASAGIEGSINGLISANWRDPNGDGKLYASEIASIVSNDGLSCVFDLSAELRAKLALVWEVLFFDGTVDIIDLTLFEINNKNSCPAKVPAHVSNGSAESGLEGERKFSNVLPQHIAEYLGPTDAPGGIAPNGALVLHAGAFAGLRSGGRSTDVSEDFTLTRLAPGVVRVTGQGMDARYGGVTSIIFDGGIGNDALRLRVGENGGPETYQAFDIPIVAFGGDGNDRIEGGLRRDRLFGGNGNDTIYGGPERDMIDGGNDDDVLHGDDGNDTIFGGRGSDFIYGEGGSDTIDGGEGGDKIWGDYPDNIVLVGRPADGDDSIHGGPGGDTIHGGPGNDNLWGDGGNDLLYGYAGSDRIDGGDGHDWVDGGDDSDPWLHGGLGNDFVVGGDANDNVLGGWGNDVLVGNRLPVGTVGGSTGDRLEGGPDGDFICGTAGADFIYGGTTALGYQGLSGQSLFAPVPFDDIYPLLTGGYTLESCTVAAPQTPALPIPGSTMLNVFLDRNNNRVHDADEPNDNGQVIRLETAGGDLIGEFLTQDVDLNGDGRIDAATERGVIQVNDLDPGTYRARLIVPSDLQGVPNVFSVTTPERGYRLITISNGQVVEGGEFGLYQRPIVRGRVLSAIGQGVGNQRVYIDSIPIGGDGNFADPNLLQFQEEYELNARTSADGSYAIAFEGNPGEYFVRLAPPTLNETFPSHQTLPAQQTPYPTANFNGGVIGPEWSPQQATVSPSGRGFAGEFANQSLTLTLDDFADHEEVTVSFDFYIIGPWLGTAYQSGTSDDRFRVEIVGGNVLLNETFARSDTFFEFESQSFGRLAGQTSALPGTGRVIARDNELNFAGRRSETYSFTGTAAFTREHFGPLQLRFSGSGLEAGKTWGIDNIRVTSKFAGQPVNIPLQGEANAGDFRISVPAGAMVASASGKTEFVDKAANNTNAPRPVATDTPAARSQANLLPAAALASSTTGRISGVRYNDRNFNGVRDSNEPAIANEVVYVDLNGDGRRNAGEPSTRINNAGQYTFDLAPGTYTIREVLREGWEETQPLSRPFAITQDGKLTEIDPVTGPITHTRMISSPISIAQWIGLAYLPSEQVLLAVGNATSGNSYLFDIDPITAKATLRVQLSDRLSEGDIAVQPSTGRLLAVTSRSTLGSFLVEINPISGHVRDINNYRSVFEGGAPTDPSAMAFSSTGELYVLDRAYSILDRVDPTTGMIVIGGGANLTPTSTIGNVAGMIWINGRLFLAAGDPRTSPPDFVPASYFLNPTNGSLTFSPAGALSESISGMAYVPKSGHIATIRSLPSGITAVTSVDFGNVPAVYIIDGRDHIEAFSGDDQIWGDNVLIQPPMLPRLVLIGDDDVLAGGDGNDIILGQQKEDTLWGGNYNSVGASSTTGNNDNLDGGEGRNLVVQWVNRNQSVVDRSMPAHVDNDADLIGQGATTTLTNIYRVRLIAGDAGFTLDASSFTLGPVELNGGNGGDTLIGSPQDDTIEGRGGNDNLQGNSGNDTFVFDVDEVLGTDTFINATEAFNGNDTLDFSSTTGIGITVNLSMSNDQPVAVGRLNLVLSVPTGFDNVIGGSGNDTITGNTLANRLTGGPGNDTLIGGSGNDVFIFGEVPIGPVETDIVEGEIGTDTIDFSSIAGSDRVTFNFRNGGTIFGPYATQLNEQSEVRRTVRSSVAPSTVERAVGTKNNDLFLDGPGAQIFVGGFGDDVYTFSTDSVADTVTEFPGEGIDRLDFSAITSASPLRIDLSATYGFARLNTTGNIDVAPTGLPIRVNGSGLAIEEVIGSSGPDRIIGNSLDNWIDGGLSADKLEGGLGDDLYAYSQATIVSGTGEFIVENANEGQDRISFALVNSNVTINLGTGTATVGAFSVTWTGGRIENAVGGNGHDILTGSTGNNELVGGPGNDQLNGGGGSDKLIGSAGNDRYLFAPLFGVFITPYWTLTPEFGSIFDPDIALDAFGRVILDASGRPIFADGGRDEIDFSGLTTATSGGLVVDLSTEQSVLGLNNVQHFDSRPTQPGSPVGIRQLAFSRITVDGQIFPTWIEDALGSLGNDTLIGNERGNVLRGGAGINTIYGRGGDDRYLFDWSANSTDILIEGTASVRGGVLSTDGADTLDFSGAPSGLNFNLSHFNPGSSTPTEFIPGVVTTPLTRILLKALGQSVTDDAQFDGNGFENLFGSNSSTQILVGNAQDNIIIGGTSNDTLNGGRGRDIVIGGAGLDTLSGFDGEDILIGGSVNFGTTDRNQIMAALNAIRRTWSEARPFAARQSDIIAGVGDPALNARFVDSGVGATIVNDGLADIIDGGADLDWIIEPGVASPALRAGSVISTSAKPLLSRADSVDHVFKQFEIDPLSIGFVTQGVLGQSAPALRPSAISRWSRSLLARQAKLSSTIGEDEWIAGLAIDMRHLDNI